MTKLTRRDTIAGMVASATAAAIPSTTRAEPTQASTARRPCNVVVLIADDMRNDFLGVAGSRISHTPNLDRLAEKSLYCANGFVTTAVCATSRASIMLGQYASRHKNWDFKTSLTEDQWKTSYHGQLQSLEYRTGYVGKWGLGGPLPHDRFEFFDGFMHQGSYYETRRGSQHLTVHQADLAIQFIEKQSKAQPFCLTVGFWAPHAQPGLDPVPAEPKWRDFFARIRMPRPPTYARTYLDRLPPSLRESYSAKLFEEQVSSDELFEAFARGYYGLIAGMDEAVGRILKALEAKDIHNDTLVIFLSDNGYFLGEHGFPGKWLIFEESIRIPLLVRFPAGQKGRHGISLDFALNIDVAPTILAAAGRPTDGMDGTNLGMSNSERARFYYEYKAAPFRCVGIRTRSRKFAIMPEHNLELAFDLDRDPFEENNLATGPRAPNWIQSMRADLIARYGTNPLAGP